MFEMTDKLRRQIAEFDREQAMLNAVGNARRWLEIPAHEFPTPEELSDMLEKRIAKCKAEEYRAGVQGEPIYRRDRDTGCLYLTGKQGEILWVN
jgi:hypothetical protein